MLKKFAFAIALAISMQSVSAYSQCDHKTGRALTNLGPVVRILGTPHVLGEQYGSVLLAEAGPRNYRGGLTFGFYANPVSRFKFTGEYLSQKLDYNFSSGKTGRWVSQYDGGGTYEYIWNGEYIKSLELVGSYSRSSQHHLSTLPCINTTLGTTEIARHLSRSYWWTGGGGFTFIPWCTGGFRLDVAYEVLKVFNKLTPDKKIHGVGVSLYYHQKFLSNLDLNIRAEMHTPYDYFEALLNWTTQFRDGYMSLGLFGAFTTGHNGFPSSTNGGLQISFIIGGADNGVSSRPCLTPDWTCCPRTCGGSSSKGAYNNLMEWVVVPALYIPEVLTREEQSQQ